VLLEKFDKMPLLFKDNPNYKLVGLNTYFNSAGDTKSKTLKRLLDVTEVSRGYSLIIF
jgi:hypothetical protein